MNVLQVKQSLAKLEKSLLANVQRGFIKQQDEGVEDVEYYIIPTNLRVTPNGLYDNTRFNAFMQQAHARNYSFIMLMYNL